MKKCPECGRKADVTRSTARGIWEGTILRLFLIRAYRCRECRRRFYGWGLTNGEPRRKSILETNENAEDCLEFSLFLKPEHREDFQNLLARLKHRERELEAEAGSGSRDTRRASPPAKPPSDQDS